MSAAPTVVNVQRDGNVTYLRWVRLDAVPADLVGAAASPARLLPAHLTPRPVRTVAARLAQSPAAADLRAHGWLVGLILAAVLCALFGGAA